MCSFGFANSNKVYKQTNKQTLISETLAGRVGVGPDDIEGYERGGLCSANGSPLWVVGETVVQLTLDQGECLHTVCVVRGLHHSCIVGCDVLALLLCSITSDPRAQDLHFRSAPVRRSTIDPAASSVVKLRRRVCIPAAELAMTFVSLVQCGRGKSVTMIYVFFFRNHLELAMEETRPDVHVHST